MNLPTKFAYDDYYRSGTSDVSNSSNSGYRLIFNESGYMYIMRRNGLREDLTKTALPPTDFYRRATLNFDGVFTQYSYPKTSSSIRSWSPVRSEPENICKFNSIWGSGACGYNSICSLSVDRRPNCTCPQEFSLLDQNDKHGSCIPNFEISCKDNGKNSSEDLYDFVELRYVDYPSGDAEHLQPQNEEQCRKACLNDCLCGADFLFGSLRPSWKQRTQIAFGIARGLLYLHEECSTQIIHCDIKPQNILIDDYYNARISDFGLAKLLAINQSQTKTAIRGTKGYVAPEWFRNTPVTVKVNDVNSFGVLLLEIICCRRSVDLEISGTGAILTDWAYDCYRHGTLDALIEDDMEAMNDVSTLERAMKVAIWCIQEVPSLRPTMRKVTQMLEGVVEVPAPPNPFPFSEISCS
jgi:hypothetical protein